ncbi:hypothetical protein DSO57_1018288 [Entomophthora muscae]|uniref:Uncharacterized protein n=1 Tax=Entomophthora muscae TaxID=34485 RepID=A0ACC2TFN9_9FUNG|nr:hypothetical protein DSO57_1018288 [Entomophthora muscae]
MAVSTPGVSSVGMERRSSGTSPSVTSPPASIKSGSRSHFNSFTSVKRGKYLGGLFSLEEFVQLRPNCGLTKLSTDLHELFITIGQALENELNANAEEMINSCFKLDDTGDGVERALDVIVNSIQEVENFRDFIDTEESALDKQLAIQIELREKKNLLQLMVRATTLVSKMERLIGLSKPEANSSAENNWTIEETQSDSKFIERLAVEYSQILSLLHQGKDLALISTLVPRVDAIGGHILKQVESHFTQCLDRVIVFKDQEDDLVALAQCFRAYDLLGHPTVCEEQFAGRVVTPAIEQILRGMSKPKEMVLNLKDVYDPLLTFLTDRCDPILKMCQYRLSQLRVDLLTNSVFPAISTALSKLAARHYQVFAAADPDIFFLNYSRTVDFLMKFQDLFPDVGAVQRFRDSATYREFMKRWPLNVYFRLRIKQLLSKLEPCYQQQLSKDPRLQRKTIKDMPLEIPGAESFTFLTPYITLHTLVQCWAEGIYVSALSHRFWKLTLQLISRFLNWQHTLVEEGDWELWLQLWLDGVRFVVAYKHVFSDIIEPRLATLGDAFSIHEAVELSLEKLSSQNEANAKALVSQMEKAANEKLRGIDSVPLTYRHTNQPVIRFQHIINI